MMLWYHDEVTEKTGILETVLTAFLTLTYP
jgi:hypothetical protein